MSDSDPVDSTGRPDNQALLQGLNVAAAEAATSPAKGVPPWENKPSVPAPPPTPSDKSRATPHTGTPPPSPLNEASSMAATPPAAGTPGTGAYAGMAWDGKRWVGTTTVPGQQNGKGTASLIIGIIAILLCGGGFILPLLAITFGWTGMKRAKQGLATNGGTAKAGFILGLIAAGMGVVIGIMYLLQRRDGGLNNY